MSVLSHFDVDFNRPAMLCLVLPFSHGMLQASTSSSASRLATSSTSSAALTAAQVTSRGRMRSSLWRSA
jgi:hypothetical protein